MSHRQHPEFKLSYLLLLGLVAILWGFNWPLTKMTLAHISPLWMVSLRMLVTVILLFIYLLLRGKFRWPGKQDFGIIIAVGFFQMTLYTWLITYGLLYVNANRSAILAYTSSIWIAPIACLFFKEHLPKLRALGLVVSLLGVVILFAPWSFTWSNHHVLLGNAALLLASLFAAIAVMYLRFSKFHLSTLQLVPWQALVALIILSFAAYLTEGWPRLHWTSAFIGEMSYISVGGTAAAYCIYVEIGQRLPALVSSLAMLAVPVVGLASSYLLLGETLSLTMTLALLLIMTGIILAALKTRKKVLPPMD